MFKIPALFATFTCFLALMGCSSSDSIKNKATAATNLHDHIEEWEKLKPELKELILLKKDIKALINELNLLAQHTDTSLKSENRLINNHSQELAQVPTPLITSSSKPKEQQNLPITNETLNPQKKNETSKNILLKQTATPKTTDETPLRIENQENLIERTETPNTTNKIAIQLGSYSTLKTLEQSWKVLQGKFKGTLTNKKPTTETFKTTNGKIIYRLKVTPFNGQKAAQATCSALIEKKQPCFITSINE